MQWSKRVMDASPSGKWDQRLRLKNYINCLPPVTRCEALLCKIVLASWWNQWLWTCVNTFTFLAFPESTKESDSYQSCILPLNICVCVCVCVLVYFVVYLLSLLSCNLLIPSVNSTDVQVFFCYYFRSFTEKRVWISTLNPSELCFNIFTTQLFPFLIVQPVLY